MSKETNDALDSVRYTVNALISPYLYFSGIKGVGKIKRLPDRVIFNEKKGATTLLKGDKVTVVKTCKGDEFDKKYGFLLAYFQHNSGMSKTQSNKYLKNLVEEDNE